MLTNRRFLATVLGVVAAMWVSGVVVKSVALFGVIAVAAVLGAIYFRKSHRSVAWGLGWGCAAWALIVTAGFGIGIARL